MTRGAGEALGIGKKSAPEGDEAAEVADRLVRAALRVLDEKGPAELTVRRIAEAAGSSTMGIYTRFGGRAGILEAVYRRGFEILREALLAVPVRRDPIDYIIDLSRGYRGFALANQSLYGFMFERPVPGFDPSPDARRAALGTTFQLLVDAVRRAIDARLLRDADPLRTSYTIWSIQHGAVSLELTHAVRTPLPGWFIDSPAAGEAVFLDGVGAVLAGLRPPDEG